MDRVGRNVRRVEISEGRFELASAGQRRAFRLLPGMATDTTRRRENVLSAFNSVRVVAGKSRDRRRSKRIAAAQDKRSLRGKRKKPAEAELAPALVQGTDYFTFSPRYGV
jgi:hypothetical protein